MYISNVLDTFNKSIACDVGSQAEILQKSNLPVVSEKIIDLKTSEVIENGADTSDPVKNTESLQAMIQSFDINKLRKYVKFALANNYQEQDNDVFLWAINPELKEKNVKV